MVYENVIEGKYVNLISCTEDDAEFTLSIRQDPQFSEYIPRISGTIEQQRNWIKKQRITEGDYFFVIWDKVGNRIGTIGIYDSDGKMCEAGRLTVKGNAFQSIEAQMLIFDFAFDVINLEEIHSYIYEDNSRALRFSKQFGGTFETSKIYKDGDKPMVKKINTSVSFHEARIKICKMIYRNN